MSDQQQHQDRGFLLRAVALAEQNMQAGRGGPFGALIVKDGRIVGEGWNQVTSSNDPTAHAEVSAIRDACAALGAFALDGAVIYASCEPCPMCLAAIYWARLDRLVYANTRAQAAAIGFDDALIHTELLKPASARLLPSLHLPLPEAEAAFRIWADKPDKIAY